ncbi:outer membrane protein [Litoreibacter roseus]|uniref:Porin n=1 Tax=Litoreibacter roseus TaxID=2601869 RepID=A0A6N6JMV0_9RHOB|nr:outer membrane beta-barrel protein [Litoreibacter roseus]GFE66648.1 porin [Litoreibacter roseus]
MKRQILFTTATCMMITSPVWAGSFEPAEPVPSPVVTAPVVDAAPIYDWTGFSVGAQLSYGDVETDGAADLDGDDFLYGLRAYYDYDFGNFVVGGGIQYDRADIDLDDVAAIDSVLRIGARVGIPSGRNFYYGTAGYARADTDDGTLSVGSSDGYFVGAGYEVFLTEQITAGAELLYHEFDDFDVDDLEAEATTLGLSVNYRF